MACVRFNPRPYQPIKQIGWARQRRRFSSKCERVVAEKRGETHSVVTTSSVAHRLVQQEADVRQLSLHQLLVHPKLIVVALSWARRGLANARTLPQAAGDLLWLHQQAGSTSSSDDRRDSRVLSQGPLLFRHY